MKQICDLHTHSTASDGTYTPTEIIDFSIEIGLSAVALCDHNTADGLTEFMSAAKGKDILAIPGAEFSVDYNGKELHVLGLFINKQYYEKVSDKMKEANARKEKSNIALINSLVKSGYNITYEEVKAKFPGSKINRAHIGAVLTEKGYTESIDHAFLTVLSEEAGHYVPTKRITVWEILDFIKEIHAKAVLAHPLLNLSKEELEIFLPEAKKHGLIGMECYYSKYDQSDTEVSLTLADKFGLKFSGGSDFHGKNKPLIKLGFGMDNLAIPYELALELQK